jgi:hypothetical protein
MKSNEIEFLFLHIVIQNGTLQDKCKHIQTKTDNIKQSNEAIMLKI